MPDALGILAPEANLHSVLIAPRHRPADAEAAADNADLMFCAKGNATADGFRPSYWSYDRPGESGAAGEVRALPSPYDPGSLDASLIRRERMDEPGPRWRDASPELEDRERAFLDFHLQVMMDESQPGPDSGFGGLAEAPLPVRVNGTCFAPEADLRTILLRRNRHDPHAWGEAEDEAEDGVGAASGLLAGSAWDADLFAQKGRAVLDAGRSASASGETAAPADASPGDRAAIAPPPGTAVSAASVSRGMPTREKPSLVLGTIATVAAVVALGSVLILVQPAPPQHLVASVAAPHRAVAAAPVAPLAAPALQPPRPGSDLDNLIAQGDERFKTGDVFAARLFYERAADAGSAHAALMVGATYDPTFLASVGVRGLRGDENTAVRWYRRARDLGDPAAAQFLKNLAPKPPG